MSTLLVIKGPNVGVKYRLGEITTIGRAPECTIQLADPSISRTHCEIHKHGRSYTLQDAGSKNGVMVNRRRVPEKVLLRNDEIVVGRSVFLFNSDYDLKNTRFSNTLVYFSAPQDETIQAPNSEDGSELASDLRGPLAAHALETVTELLASSDRGFPEALQSTLETLMRLFSAERGCIMMWDEVTQELQPMVAVSEGEQLAVSQHVVQTVFREKQAVLTSNPEIDYRYAQEKDSGGKHSIMCVPLIFKDEVIGLLHLERLRLEDYKLEDIRLLQSVANLAAVAIHQAQKQGRLTPGDEPEKKSKKALIGVSAAFREAVAQAKKVAPHESSILITGETGSGKEVIARTIHESSHRANRPFVALNCAAIPESLFESELFGHEKGAFTGAVRMNIGKIESAHGGTLFLDEIGEMSMSVQPKLLRFLQERIFYRVGGMKPVSVDVRVLAATNQELRKQVARGRFREDLMYRLNVVTIELPPLRVRRDDIRPLAEHFMQRHARSMNKKLHGITDAAIMALEDYPWPGNVRELENCIERAVLLSDEGVLRPDHFQFDPAIADAMSPRHTPAPVPREMAERETIMEESEPSKNLSLREMERQMVYRALVQARGNQVKASELLEIHRNTLRKKIQEFQIDIDEFCRRFQ